MTVRTAQTPGAACELAGYLLDPQRVRAVVVVTEYRRGEPYFDANAIAEDCGDEIEVVSLTGRTTFPFSDAMPSLCQVYGGAARVYPKGVAWVGEPFAAPLYLARSAAEATKEAPKLVEFALTAAYRPYAPPARESPATELSPVGAAMRRVAEAKPATRYPEDIDADPALSQAPEERAIADDVPETDDLLDLLEQLRQEVAVERFRHEQDTAEANGIIKGLYVQNAKLRSDLERLTPKPHVSRRAPDDPADLEKELREAYMAISELREKLSAEPRNRKPDRRKPSVAAAGNEAWQPELFASPEDTVRHAVYVTWTQRISGHDKADYPLPAFSVAACFADSLAALTDVQRGKAFKAAVDVLTDRARDIASRRVHPLRSGDGGNDSPMTREDGAVCFRASIETSTASARRLHYWRLPDGSIELSRVVLHDDTQP